MSSAAPPPYQQDKGPGGAYPPGQYAPQQGQYPPPQGQYGAPPPGQYAPPPQGYYPPGPPAGAYAPPPANIHVAAPPAVTVIQTGGGVGSCPNCRMGNFTEHYGCCAIFLAIFFFPIGILCCLAMRERQCTNCGYTTG